MLNYTRELNLQVCNYTSKCVFGIINVRLTKIFHRLVWNSGFLQETVFFLNMGLNYNDVTNLDSISSERFKVFGKELNKYAEAI